MESRRISVSISVTINQSSVSISRLEHSALSQRAANLLLERRNGSWIEWLSGRNTATTTTTSVSETRDMTFIATRETTTSEIEMSRLWRLTFDELVLTIYSICEVSWITRRIG